MAADSLRQPLLGLKAFGSIAGGAVVLWIVYHYDSGIHQGACGDAVPGYGGVQMCDWMAVGLDVILPLAFLLVTMFGFVSWAIVSRRYY